MLGIGFISLLLYVEPAFSQLLSRHLAVVSNGFYSCLQYFSQLFAIHLAIWCFYRTGGVSKFHTPRAGQSTILSKDFACGSAGGFAVWCYSRETVYLLFTKQLTSPAIIVLISPISP